jgi:hypothetical protein
MTVLFTDGDFRLVRNREREYLGSFIQHNHPAKAKSHNRTSFDCDGWMYCLYTTGGCTECNAKVPAAMKGLMTLENWKR